MTKQRSPSAHASIRLTLSSIEPTTFSPEPGQIVGQTVLPFSDHDVAREAIARRTA